MSDPPLPPPLVASVEPVAGETLMSLLTRSCQANGFERPSQLLQVVRFSGDPRFAPFTGVEHAAALAHLIRVDPSEIEQRMHSPLRDAVEPTMVAWFGAGMERRFLEARGRRVAPAALLESPHHRAAWTVRALTFCPETFQELISACPACTRGLDWWKTEGQDRCEHCRASLTDASSGYVDEALWPELRLATDLIACSAEARASALSRLPEPFSGWVPGEVFSALVELGAAYEHPGANRRSPEAKALARGRLGEASPAVLASGWRMLSQWPQSFVELASRVRQALPNDDASPRALRDLGLLGRHLDRRLPQTAFRRLVREHLGAATLAVKAPIKLKIGLEVERESGALLNATQAARMSGISAAVLGRLSPDGESFAGGRAGQGGALLFHANRLRQSARVYDDALSPAAAAARLGVPTYCLPALVRRRLVTLVTDSDILLMKRIPYAVSRESIRGLNDRFGRARDDATAGSDRLHLGLAGSFGPSAWAGVLKALLVGRRGLAGFDPDDGQTPVTRRIYADRDVVAELAGNPKWRWVPRGATVTADGAALLLGTSLPVVLSLISEGWLRAEHCDLKWLLRVDRLADFRGHWVLASELNFRLGGRASQGSRLCPGPDPAFSTAKTRGWSRSVAERQWGLGG